MPCYNCDLPSTTREHVPPLGFFPRGFRNNLWTVPSCARHNLDNSLDVEYARNVIVSHRNVRGTAQEFIVEIEALVVSFRHCLGTKFVRLSMTSAVHACAARLRTITDSRAGSTPFAANCVACPPGPLWGRPGSGPSPRPHFVPPGRFRGPRKN